MAYSIPYEELKKELASKYDIELVRKDIEVVKKEIDIVRKEMKFLMAIVVLIIVMLNQNSVEFLLKVFGLIK